MLLLSHIPIDVTHIYTRPRLLSLNTESKMKVSREHNYVTHTLAEHHRILREGNRFKKDVLKIQECISKFILEVSVSEQKKMKVRIETDASTETKLTVKGQDPKTSPLTKKKRIEQKKKKKASERLSKIKRGGHRHMSRAEVDSALKEALLRLSDWSQRACDIMQKQMEDITKLYMATMDYNIHLNLAYPVIPTPVPQTSKRSQTHR